MSNVAESGEERSIIWGMFIAATLNAATFTGKNYSIMQNFSHYSFCHSTQCLRSSSSYIEEFESHQDRSVEPDVLMGQSIVLGEIKAEVRLQNENPSNHHVWQQDLCVLLKLDNISFFFFF